MHPKDRNLSENMRRVLTIQRNYNYVLGKFYKRKFFIKFSAIKLIEVYAKKKGITKSFDDSYLDSSASKEPFEYINIFRELIKLRYIRHVGKKSHWLPNEGVVSTKKGVQWLEKNRDKGDYYL